MRDLSNVSDNELLREMVETQRGDNRPDCPNHQPEAQMVCETCGYRESLPPGSLVVSAETVAEIKRLRDEAKVWANGVPPDSFYQGGRVDAYDSVLSLLGVKEEG